MHSFYHSHLYYLLSDYCFSSYSAIYLTLWWKLIFTDFFAGIFCRIFLCVYFEHDSSIAWNLKNSRIQIMIFQYWKKIMDSITASWRGLIVVSIWVYCKRDIVTETGNFNHYNKLCNSKRFWLNSGTTMTKWEECTKRANALKRKTTDRIPFILHFKCVGSVLGRFVHFACIQNKDKFTKIKRKKITCHVKPRVFEQFSLFSHSEKQKRHTSNVTIFGYIEQ